MEYKNHGNDRKGTNQMGALPMIGAVGIAIALLAIPSTGAAPLANQVHNADLEIWALDEPVLWTTEGDVSATSDAASGTTAALLRASSGAPSARLSQAFDTPVSTLVPTYELSFAYKLVDEDGNAYAGDASVGARVWAKDAAGDVKVLIRPKVEASEDFVYKTVQWQNFFIPPNPWAEVGFVLELGEDASQPRFYVDDVSFGPLPP